MEEVGGLSVLKISFLPISLQLCFQNILESVEDTGLTYRRSQPIRKYQKTTEQGGTPTSLALGF